MLSKTPIFLVFALLGLARSPALEAAPDFENEIRPILEKNCVRCHKAGKAKGELRMDNYEEIMKGGYEAEGSAIVPGKPDESEIIYRTHLRPIDEGFMPDEGQSLSDADKELLTAWIESGAPWPKGATLKERKPDPIQRVALPKKAPADAREAAAMLDDILKRENAGHKVITTPVIDDAAFLRRATIDLIGRIPTMKEVAAFENWGDNRREKLVEKLLTHERFADRWTVFFADMLRIRSNIAGGSALLAFVNASIKEEKSYDVLVRELISASGKANANPAVGYILGDDVQPMELAAATSQVFLGVRIGCAMCHDHPFDDWKQRDFYDLAAFFGKTKKVQGRQRGTVYATEGHEMTVLWPPEDKADPGIRKPVAPNFPFALVDYGKKPHFITRFEAKRMAQAKDDTGRKKTASIDTLLDSVETSPGRPPDPVLAEAREDSRKLGVLDELYRASELRNQLADLITDPNNGYFARAFVNRVWAELVGHGFVEPLDNFSDYNELRHASTLDFLAREFIASGYDLRHLIRIIARSDAYGRAHLDADVALAKREHSERNFSAAPMRRMLSEVLYDSLVVAGHLSEFKWPQGANLRKIERQVRVPTGEMVAANPDVPSPAPAAPAMQPSQPAARADGYDLESSLDLDFNALLTREEKAEIDEMRMKSDEQIEAGKIAAIAKEQDKLVMKYTTKTVIDEVDDNPRFNSAMRMATPAPPAHFLRVFGQPQREALGEFRDASASLRQQLMMLNGRLTHEASRVAPREPIHKLLQQDQARAIDWAYREILTRFPSSEEKADARLILEDAPTPADGMADLRWALLNSHEFRYLP